MEAVAIKVSHEDEKAAKAQKMKQWRDTSNRDNYSHLDQYR